MSRISLVQLARSVRKFNLNRPFICPILIKGCLQSAVRTRLVAKVAFIPLILALLEAPYGIKSKPYGDGNAAEKIMDLLMGKGK